MAIRNKIEEEFIFELIDNTLESDLHYIYRGEFSQSISAEILLMAERNFGKVKMPARIKKRVFHIMVESIQNITRHQDVPEDLSEEQAIFVIQKIGTWYFVTSGNLIDKDKIAPLKSKLDKVNSLDSEELTGFYREILSNGKLSDKGGAGLGLIEMARKSGNKLSYSFREINDERAYFYLHTGIDTAGENIKPEKKLTTLEYIKKIHAHINQLNIALIYSSIFDQEGILSLIMVLKSSMKGGNITTRRRMFAILIEMLQNILHHGEKYDENDRGKRGSFYINNEETYYRLNSINLIKNKNIESLKSKIDFINTLDEDGLEKYYQDKLFNFEYEDAKTAGLGLIEIKMKSKHNLEYYFSPINEEISLYTLTVILNK